jgi:hypothetical protein
LQACEASICSTCLLRRCVPAACQSIPAALADVLQWYANARTRAGQAGSSSRWQLPGSTHVARPPGASNSRVCHWSAAVPLAYRSPHLAAPFSDANASAAGKKGRRCSSVLVRAPVSNTNSVPALRSSATRSSVWRDRKPCSAGQTWYQLDADNNLLNCLKRPCAVDEQAGCSLQCTDCLCNGAVTAGLSYACKCVATLPAAKVHGLHPFAVQKRY